MGRMLAAIPFGLLLAIIIDESLGLDGVSESVVYFCSGSASYLTLNFIYGLKARQTND